MILLAFLIISYVGDEFAALFIIVALCQVACAETSPLRKESKKSTQ
jgi:hypothetical protein